MSVFDLVKDHKMFLGCGVLALATLVAAPIFGQGVPYDWSHHHLVFSQPQTPAEALKLQRDPRIMHQWRHRGALVGFPGEHHPKENIQKDWSMDLGSGAKVGAGNFPAKYSFTTSTASCSADFVVYNTSATGTALAQATASGTFTAGTPSGTVAVNGVTLTASSSTNTGTDFQVSTSTTTNATNLAAAINRNVPAVVASVNSATVDLKAAAWGLAGNSIALADSLSFFTWAGSATALSGGAGQGTVVAYNNLYSGCSAPVPTVMWQYDTAYGANSATADSSEVATSVVLSSNGEQVAFIESTSSASSLVVLKWASASQANLDTAGTTNVNPTTDGSYFGCTAPCMIKIAFSGSHLDTNSSPFYDYANDLLYVGDNSGVLHKFQDVFKSTAANNPVEVTTDWPITVKSGVTLTSPVYDSSSGNVFVASSGGVLYSYKATTGVLTANSGVLALTGSKGIVDGPVVDSAAKTVYVTVGNDASTGGSGTCKDTSGCNGVFQFSTGLTGTPTETCTESGTTWATGTNCGKESVFGVGSPTTVLYNGDFDNHYYTGDGTTGNLWSVGATGTPAPKLMTTPLSSFNSGTVFAAANVDNPLASAAAAGSPVTEIFNGTTDYIFLSVSGSSSVGTAPSGCANGNACVYSFDVTTAPAGCGTSACEDLNPTAGIVATGGASGMIIDNTATTPTGTSQVYYSTLGNQACTTSGGTGGCAIQASQSALN